MKSNMYSIVLFVVVITSCTSLVLCSYSNNEEAADIFMVVDEQTSTLEKEMSKATDNPVQIGRFDIGEGKLLTLSRPANKVRNCVGLYQPCGALDWCCEGLLCTGVIQGECLNDAQCKSKGQSCDLVHPCCQPNTCDGYLSGTCV